tara:strand:- start:888 stop:1403 length:516 start_codon:yes stop_codon:yes gene_type:complete
MTNNYKDIVLMAKKICKGSLESEDVAHFAIEQFMYHERAQELVDSGKGMSFLSGIMWRSFNSSTSQYHTLFRQKGRVHSLTPSHDNRVDSNTYDHDQDSATEAICGVLEDMKADTIELWFRATLMEMWIKEPNFSELARQTKIPRTTIAKAVDEAKNYIQETLENNNIQYE